MQIKKILIKLDQIKKKKNLKINFQEQMDHQDFKDKNKQSNSQNKMKYFHQATK